MLLTVGKVELHELVRCLEGGGAQEIDLKKRMRRVVKKDKVLDVPLDKHELEKVCFLRIFVSVLYIAPLIVACIVIPSCGARNTSFFTWRVETEPLRLLYHVHGMVYLSSSLTALHLSPSRNISRLTYLANPFGA